MLSKGRAVLFVTTQKYELRSGGVIVQEVLEYILAVTRFSNLAVSGNNSAQSADSAVI